MRFITKIMPMKIFIMVGIVTAKQHNLLNSFHVGSFRAYVHASTPIDIHMHEKVISSVHMYVSV